MAVKRFRYRLEPLLKIRQHREKERQKEHAAAIQQVLKQKLELTAIDRCRLDTLDHQRLQQVGKFSIADALVCSRYLVKLKRERMAGNGLLHGLEKEAEKKRRKLVDAARERKIYEMLKDKQQLRHRQAIEKQEQKELDEVAIVAFRRNKQNG